MKLKKVVNTGLNLILLLAVLSLFTSLSRNNFNTHYGTIFGFKIDKVVGESMLPTIKEQFVISREIKSEEIVVGDVIVFYKFYKEYNQEAGVIHRVIKKQEDGILITQGDNNLEPDPFLIYPNEVKRKALYKLSWNKIEPIISKPRNND